MTVLFLLFSSAGWAQEARVEQYPIDAERFRPPVDPYGYAVTESATTLEHLQVGFGLWGSYADDTAVLYADGKSVVAWVDFALNQSQLMPDAVRARFAAAGIRPETISRDELARIPGLGPAKIARFGDDILAVVRRHARDP